MNKVFFVFPFISFLHLCQKFQPVARNNFHAHNFISEYLFIDYMSRLRYWKLTVEDLRKARYEPKKVLMWEIKCSKDDQGSHFGVFCYRNGTPWEYTPIHGNVFYHNMINKEEVDQITKFLKDKFGGEVAEKGNRIFLKNSRETYIPKEIADLAMELGSKFEVSTELTVELENFTEPEQQQSNLPSSKLLPIPGK